MAIIPISMQCNIKNLIILDRTVDLLQLELGDNILLKVFLSFHNLESRPQNTQAQTLQLVCKISLYIRQMNYHTNIIK